MRIIINLFTTNEKKKHFQYCDGNKLRKSIKLNKINFILKKYITGENTLPKKNKICQTF